LIDKYQIFKNSKTDRIYISKGFPKLRIKWGIAHPTEAPHVSFIKKRLELDYIKQVSKYMETKNNFGFIKEHGNVVLRKTSGGKQEIKAKYIEAERKIFVLTLQKYTTKTGIPHNVYFSFVNDEINQLRNFLDSIPYLPESKQNSQKIDELELKNIIQTRDFLIKNKPFIQEIIESNITQTDIAILKHRKKQVDTFKRMLEDENYFTNLMKRKGISKKEGLWQKFFEKNDWIFGYGLNYIFTSSLDDKKLEQTISGYSVNERGKIIDGLLKTKGLINLLCFAEIKHHQTELLAKREYRPYCWGASTELSGAVAQVQKSVQKATQKIGEELRIKDGEGNPTGELAYMFQPKSFIVAGSLNEFNTEFGVNKEKLSSFELFRQNIVNPEIITFDELYERAKFIIKINE
jgi:hypothetical protein